MPALQPTQQKMPPPPPTGRPHTSPAAATVKAKAPAQPSALPCVCAPLPPEQDRIRRVRAAFRGCLERERQRLEGVRRHALQPKAPALDTSPCSPDGNPDSTSVRPAANLAMGLADAWPSTTGLRLLSPLPEQPLERDSRSTLAMEAEDLLGYVLLRQQLQAPSRLQRLLARLAVAAYDPLSVAEYKARLQAGSGTAQNGDSSSGWQNTPLAHYAKPIPEPLLRCCVEIRRYAADARFFVEELPGAGPSFAPLLSVSLGDSRATCGPGIQDEECAYLAAGAAPRGSANAEPVFHP